MVEFPVRGQKLRGDGIVRRIESVLQIKLVRIFHLRHVHFHAQTGRFRHGNLTIHDLQRRFRQALSVLSDPVGINCRDLARSSCRNVGEHGQ